MKVCVIGGGASGMMAATMIARNGHDVSLFEKNEKLGKKIYITGKGRCNVTNATVGEEFLKNVVNGKKFVIGAVTRFDSKDTWDFFHSVGISLKLERGNRVFPESDKSSDIIKGLEKSMQRAGVKVYLNSKVTKILKKEDTVAGVEVGGKTLNFDAVIVATGGKSYPSTGSTGDGYEFAKSLGHTVVQPVPALAAIKLKGNECKDVEGLSLKNVTFSAFLSGKQIYKSDVGEMLFTSNGVSGPVVLSASSFINRCDFNEVKVEIDFKPALSADALLLRIDREITMLKAKQFSSLLEQVLPKSLIPIFAKRLRVDVSSKANQLSKEKRIELANLLKHFKFDVLGLEDFNSAIVTAGGVSTKEINPKVMKSKLYSNLYFIGEVLDVDALTGGFNLQLAFSTAATCAYDFPENKK